MNPNSYQEATKLTEIYSDAASNFVDKIVNSAEYEPWKEVEKLEDLLKIMYCAGKLNGEAGEVAEIVFKAFRGGELTDEDKSKLFFELGDVLWYVARIADLCGQSLSDVMLANIEKLQDRKNRGVIHGSGDNR